jgi:hypothetical protein
MPVSIGYSIASHPWKYCYKQSMEEDFIASMDADNAPSMDALLQPFMDAFDRPSMNDLYQCRMK